MALQTLLRLMADMVFQRPDPHKERKPKYYEITFSAMIAIYLQFRTCADYEYSLRIHQW